MKATRYYRLAFWLPLLAGALLAPWLYGRWILSLLFGLVAEGISHGAGDEPLKLVLLVALLVPIALAYLVVALGCLWALRNRGEQEHRKLARRAPLWLGLATACVTVLIFLLPENASGVHVPALVLGVLAVVVGYAYLGLAAVVLALLRASSIVESP